MKTPGVLAFRPFEFYLDRIEEWISDLESGKRPSSIVKAIRRTLTGVRRIGAARYRDLSTFLSSAADALELGEIVGARYVLFTALACTSAHRVQGVRVIEMPRR